MYMYIKLFFFYEYSEYEIYVLFLFCIFCGCSIYMYYKDSKNFCFVDRSGRFSASVTGRGIFFM